MNNVLPEETKKLYEQQSLLRVMLLCTGVLMEGLSIEDDDICFNLFCYNAQPDIKIDYSSGDFFEITFNFTQLSQSYHLFFFFLNNPLSWHDDILKQELKKKIGLVNF